ncbi:hypothetical protein [Sphingosinicella sp. BN140058]|uniref:hypothetical protein n=1 Tax=Sphingosinicella sp. BN140058 TaxID=1892855 RepID=UPI001013938E|nr:hypothetical protein [Sphingosinicella sp. BN140058]QAY80232.1 hypothetical protein ETR14_26680 [Sphingosinicella sp. BN140058]
MKLSNRALGAIIARRRNAEKPAAPAKAMTGRQIGAMIARRRAAQPRVSPELAACVAAAGFDSHRAYGA